MKKLRFFSTLSLVGAILFFTSCNSGKDKPSDKPVTDSNTVTQPETTTPESALMQVMLVKHKVADYAKWKSGYDGHDSARLANGLHSYVIARGVEDSNMVMVAMKMDDLDKAKAMASSPDMKEVMKKAGVLTNPEPEISFNVDILNDTTAITQTIRMMVRHKVKDWDTWKKAFDSHKQARIDAGLTDRVVGHAIGDDHQVTLVFAVADLAKAKAFASSKDLQDKMKEAGVDGPPGFFYYRIVQKY